MSIKSPRIHLTILTILVLATALLTTKSLPKLSVLKQLIQRSASTMSSSSPLNFEIRKSSARGNADHGWLKSFHTFSFADYYSDKFSQFGPLRVINEDRVAPNTGFP